MKKFIIGLLVLLLTLSFAGCGSKSKLEKKAGVEVTEKILKDAGVDANIDGDKVIVKGEDGQELTIGAGEWPSSNIAKYIPEFKAGNIVSVMEAEDSVFIMIEDISEEDFTAYLEEIKKAFTNETYEMDTGNGIVYMAGNSESINVMLTYEKEVGLSIAVSILEPEED